MGYPLDTGRDAWKYRGVKNLLGGINTSEQPDTLADEQTITMRNVVAKAAGIFCDSGYDPFGQVVVGQPQASYQFDRQSLLTDLLLITTATVYLWSDALYRWLLVKGTAGTTSTAPYAAGTVDIVVASAAGFTTGDLIGVDLDNGDQLQTTITVAGTTFTMADAVPVGRSILINAIVVRAVALSGTVDLQVSLTTIPANDWTVFTNGVDIVKRYDGTDCVDVPNLPSGGNTICRAVAYYNTALFLLNTTEGGTAYRQRARRSDQTDPTNWTTGTSGFDDLLEVSDVVLFGEVLGPYLIIYRERSIARGSFIGSSGLNYRFETMILSEGALSSGAIVNMGDYHIFIGHTNVYEYRGGYDITPVGDNIFYLLFGYYGELDPAYTHRLFSFYVEELDEVWIAYVSTASTTGFCDRVLRYNVSKAFWYSRYFNDNIIGYGFYQKSVSIIWSAATGTWQTQTYPWNSRQILSNSPITHLCSGITNEVMEYDYYSTLDNGAAIAYNIETKDFALPDSEFRFDMIEMMIQGSDVLLEYSTDAGLTWNTMATITQAVQDKVRVYAQIVAHKIRFRWSGTDPEFALRWFGFSYKAESLY